MGTIGKFPSSSILEELLIENADKKVITIIMKRIGFVRSDIKNLKTYVHDIKFYSDMLTLLKKHHIGELLKIQPQIPPKIFSYWRNVVLTEFKCARKEQ